jgi:hypothetical protein
VTAWRELARTFERLARALLRFLAGVARGTPRVPVHTVPGPPPHWVERVRQGAPGLLEPPPREQVEVAERTTQSAPRPAVPRRAATVAQLRQSLQRLQRSLPRPVAPRAAAAATASHPPPPAAADASVASPIVRRDPPPGHEPPPAAAASVETGPTERPAASAVPARPRIEAARSRPAPVRRRPPAPVVPSTERPDRPVGAELRGDSPQGSAPRPKLVLPPVYGPSARPARTWPHADVALAASAAVAPLAQPDPGRPELALVRTPLTRAEPAPVRDPWPDLPAPVAHGDVDADAALRTWERGRRVEREQVRL